MNHEGPLWPFVLLEVFGELLCDFDEFPVSGLDVSTLSQLRNDVIYQTARQVRRFLNIGHNTSST